MCGINECVRFFAAPLRQARFFFSFCFCCASFSFHNSWLPAKDFYVFALCLLALYKGLTELCLRALQVFSFSFFLWIHIFICEYTFAVTIEENGMDAFLCRPRNAWKWAPRHAKYVCVACEWRTLSSFFSPSLFLNRMPSFSMYWTYVQWPMNGTQQMQSDAQSTM